MIKTIKLLALALLLPMAMIGNPKREFRGAWMHTIGQSQYAKQTTAENQEYLRGQLDLLQQAGVNAVLFQVRPAADAFYNSNFELWSKFLTADGNAPDPYWDPLQFMIDEAHERGMELHAWLNPYRVTTAKDEKLPAAHLYHREPWRFVKYVGDGKIYFDPALPENRDFISKVVLDIVENYDVDGIHFDDYFYPYPANKKDFPDDKSYAKYGGGMDRGDWRRQNVDKLIEQLHVDIRNSSKPWVRFGISPFGVWRNIGSDNRGSDTKALQNYDDLYADVLLWAERGWIDYLIPQLYWELEHPRASYLTLVEWWAGAVDPKCQLYIGQDVQRSMDFKDLLPSECDNQLGHKMLMSRAFETISGNCWWPGYSITKNYKGVADELAEDWQSTVALVPSYGEADEQMAPVEGLKSHGGMLSWECPEPEGKASDPVRFVVYCFDDDENIDFDDPSFIVCVTPNKEIEVCEPGLYGVTALDRLNHESAPSHLVMYQRTSE